MVRSLIFSIMVMPYAVSGRLRVKKAHDQNLMKTDKFYDNETGAHVLNREREDRKRKLDRHLRSLKNKSVPPRTLKALKEAESANSAGPKGPHLDGRIDGLRKTKVMEDAKRFKGEELEPDRWMDGSTQKLGLAPISEDIGSEEKDVPIMREGGVAEDGPAKDMKGTEEMGPKARARRWQNTAHGIWRKWHNDNVSQSESIHQ